ncbi:MAG: type IV pili twitching motility protein PilT [Phycisphaerae bacterium]|nr:type IV pili twitching motility protein PilT [Phycisphaerae bacterium]HAW96785.1 type IV pili twitching motility protein PilT [Phycisphaerales bacterium]|tara:strand:- start:160 stop:1215 length:1056 start_codon:yes stop_codon:yes gene_type:complete
MHLETILRKAHELDASDVHLVAGHKPMLRIHTVMHPLDHEVLTPEAMERALESLISPSQLETFTENNDLDFSHEIEGFGRYRANAHRQRQGVGIAMRLVRTKIPPMSELTLPEVISRLTYLPRGLVLVTGDTGSGKSTTLAAMIQTMNERYRKHIITLEDPVEYVFKSDQCLIEQRELGADMPTFASGLKHALRQDPDIILVGEMRDLDTASLAISAAETGHLVLSTLHTVNASQTVERIIDMYPAGQQNQIRSMLANTLQAVISQTLFSRIDRAGMVPAIEILLCTPAVRNIIREARTFEIPNVIETNRQIGMNLIDNGIAELYFNGLISREDAVAQSAHPEKLEKMIAA